MIKKIFDEEDEYEQSYGTSLLGKFGKSEEYELPKSKAFEYEPYEQSYDMKMGIKPAPYASAVTPSLVLTTHSVGGTTGAFSEYYDAPVLGKY